MLACTGWVISRGRRAAAREKAQGGVEEGESAQAGGGVREEAVEQAEVDGGEKAQIGACAGEDQTECGAEAQEKHGVPREYPEENCSRALA